MSEAHRLFGEWAAAYDRYRPGYPMLLYRRLLALRPRSVLDLACGTGRVLAELAALADPASEWAYRVGIDSDERMLRVARSVQARSSGPPAEFVAGRAEQLPVGDHLFDLVTVAQAFHWFEPRRASREILRVLRPLGCLAVWWNERDSSRSALLGEYERLLHRYLPDSPRLALRQEAAQALRRSDVFEVCRFESWQHEVPMTLEGMLGYTESASYVQRGLPEAIRAEFREELRAAVLRHHGSCAFVVPFRVEWTLLRRRAAIS